MRGKVGKGMFLFFFLKHQGTKLITLLLYPLFFNLTMGMVSRTLTLIMNHLA